MSSLSEIVNFCNQRILLDTIKDFPGAFNGLQVENNGNVSKIGASVAKTFSKKENAQMVADLPIFVKSPAKLVYFLVFTVLQFLPVEKRSHLF